MNSRFILTFISGYGGAAEVDSWLPNFDVKRQQQGWLLKIQAVDCESGRVWLRNWKSVRISHPGTRINRQLSFKGIFTPHNHNGFIADDL